MKKIFDAPPPSVPDQVQDALMQAIAQGRYRPGDKLPSEHELAEQLGASRASVKTALDRLRTLGLAEARVGDGTYVRQPDPAELVRSYGAVLQQPDSLAELLELARGLEQLGAALARNAVAEAGGLASEEADALRGSLERLDEAVRASAWEDALRFDAAFHRAVLACARNRYLTLAYDLVVQAILLSCDAPHARAAVSDPADCRALLGSLAGEALPV